MSIATNNNGNDQQYAAAQILNNTPELLDKIPSQQDIFHIIRAQRVSTQWKNITAGSRKLQEALFIRQVTRDGSHLGTTGFNSLASNADPLAFAPGGDFRYEGGTAVDCTLSCQPCYYAAMNTPSGCAPLTEMRNILLPARSSPATMAQCGCSATTGLRYRHLQRVPEHRRQAIQGWQVR